MKIGLPIAKNVKKHCGKAERFIYRKSLIEIVEEIMDIVVKYMEAVIEMMEMVIEIV